MEWVRIIFGAETPHGTYRDALYLPPDHGLTDEQIEVLKQERVDNWIAVITAPPVEEPPQDG
jgi:hypothetical protein